MFVLVFSVFLFFLSGGVWFGWFVVWSRWLYALIQKKCCLIQMVVCADPEGCDCIYCCVLGCSVFFSIGDSYGLIQKEYGLIQKGCCLIQKGVVVYIVVF